MPRATELRRSKPAFLAPCVCVSHIDDRRRRRGSRGLTDTTTTTTTANNGRCSRTKPPATARPRSARRPAAAASDASGQVAILQAARLAIEAPGQRTQLFKKLDIELSEAELVLLVGENGTGKSTLLFALSGLSKPKKGKLYFEGKRITSAELRKHVAVLLQFPGQYFLGRTVLEELLFIQDKESRTPDTVRRVLKLVKLENVSLMTDPAKLSGGQQRRLALAVQLMRSNPKPRIFLLDEPLAGVDPSTRADIIDLLVSLRQVGYLVAVVTHDPQELLTHCDRVIQVARGRLYPTPRHVLDKARTIRAAHGHTIDDPGPL